MKQHIKLVDLQKQYQSIKDEIDNTINQILSKSNFIGGEEVSQFERNFADYNKASFCIPCANGTDALEICLKVLDIQKDDEVILPANSFIATSEAVSNAGGKVVFCDVDSDTFLIDTNKLLSLITPKTKVLLPVHLFGQMADMAELSKIAKKNSLYIIEDAAQSHGATFEGKSPGSLSDFSTFSFYPGKNLGAYGDAGAIICNNENYYMKAKKIANHGRVDKYNHVIEGRNSRMDTLQAAILNIKLNYLDTWTLKRQKAALLYRNFLAEIKEITLPFVDPSASHVFHLFVIKVPPESRSGLISILKEKGIETGIHYPTPLPFLQAYHKYNFSNIDFPIATKLSKEILSLPLYPELEIQDIEYICDIIKHFYQ